MALCSLITRQSSKLRVLQKLGTIQLSTFNRVKPLNNVLNGCSKILKNEQCLTKPFLLTTRSFTPAQGNHTALWKVEKVVSLALLGLLPGAIAFPSQVMDAALAISIVMHQYWGMEAVIVDYVRPVIVGNILPKVAKASLIILSVATLAGLFSFIYNDIGIGNAVRKLWAIKSH